VEWVKRGESYLVRLERGEEVLSSLADFAAEHVIGAGTILGIGALENVILGYYELATKTYHRKEFSGEYELVNLTGNFSLVDGHPFPHCHVTLGGVNYETIGGHLFQGRVAITCELTVIPFPVTIQRQHDDEVGLNLWDLKAAEGT